MSYNTNVGNTGLWLHYGSKGEQVTQLQKMLQLLGYLDKNITTYGNFATKTADAVNRYKAAKGLTNNGKYAGVVGDTTWGALEKDFNNYYNNYGNNKNILASEGQNSGGYTSYSGTNSGTTKTASSLGTAKASTGSVSKPYASTSSVNLKLGDGTNELNTTESKQIEELQKMLQQRGYLDKNITAYGYYGPKTADAVNRYKEANKLTNTGLYAGIVGDTTWNYLKNDYYNNYGNNKNIFATEHQNNGGYTSYSGTNSGTNNLSNKSGTTKTTPNFGTTRGTDSNQNTISSGIDLKYGDGTNALNTTKSQQIKELQIMLQQRGYLDKNITAYGYFGPKTADAVNRYKEANKLTNTGLYAGIVGDTTWNYLKNDYYNNYGNNKSILATENLSNGGYGNPYSNRPNTSTSITGQNANTGASKPSTDIVQLKYGDGTNDLNTDESKLIKQVQ